jgi:hypothetical protein
MDDEIRRLQERVIGLEKRIDFLYDQLNFSHSVGPIEDPQLVEAIRKGDKIEAIKIYRMLTNCDLLTGKNAVEDMWKQFH